MRKPQFRPRAAAPARRVKLADFNDHLDIRRLAPSADRDAERLRR